MTVFAHPTDLNACSVGTGLIARQRRVAGVSFPSFPSTLSVMGTRKSHDGGTTTPLVPVVPTNMREGTYVGTGAHARAHARARAPPRLYSLCISQNRGNDGNESVSPDAVLRISRSHESLQRWERTGTSGGEWERDRASPEKCFVYANSNPKSPEQRDSTYTRDERRTQRSRVSSVHQRGRPLMHLLLWCPTQSSCCSSDSGVGAADAPVARGASTTMQTTTTKHDTTTRDEATAITAATGGGEAA